MTVFFSQLINGLSLGSIYALILSLIHISEPTRH